MFKNLSHFNSLILFRMGIFGAAQGWGSKKSPLPKICSTYPKMMKLGTVIPYLKKIQKIYESRDTPPEFCWHQYFSPEISKCFYIKNYRYRLHLDTFLFLCYTLPKEDPKNIWITWRTSWVLLTSLFFTRNQQMLLYQELQI